MRLRRRITINIIAVILYSCFCSAGLSFSIEEPEGLEKMSEKQQMEWINTRAKRAYRKQLSVGQARYQERLSDKKRVAAEMQNESKKIRTMIAGEKAARKKRESAASLKVKLPFFLAFALIMAGLILYFYRRREVVKVEIPNVSSMIVNKKGARNRRIEALESLEQTLRDNSAYRSIRRKGRSIK